MPLNHLLRHAAQAVITSLDSHRILCYTIISLLSVALTIVNALRNYSNFYSVAIFLSKSNRSVLALANFGFLVSLLCGHIVQRIFFGNLRPNEVERLYDRLWFFITESLLAFTIFRDEFDIPFAMMFGFLLFVKSFHWLSGDRIEWMDQRPYPGPSPLFHVRMTALFIILWLTDVLMFLIAVENTITNGVGGMVLFASEYGILMASVLNTISKYLLSTYELRRAGRRGGENAPPWENKSMWIFYIELATDFLKLTTYLVFFMIIITFYGLPLNIVRDVYITARSFITRLRALHRYQTATRNMDQRYPNATAEELADMSDHTCIICREEMDIHQARQPGQGATPDGPNTTPKKLPCGHIFHFHCLRSWLERQQSCPTCRRTVLESEPQGQGQNPVAAAAQGPRQPVAELNPNPNRINNPLGNPLGLVGRLFGPPVQPPPAPGQFFPGQGPQNQNNGPPTSGNVVNHNQPQGVVIQYNIQYQIPRNQQGNNPQQSLQPAPQFPGFPGPSGTWQPWPRDNPNPQDVDRETSADIAQARQPTPSITASTSSTSDDNSDTPPNPRDAAALAALRRLNGGNTPTRASSSNAAASQDALPATYVSSNPNERSLIPPLIPLYGYPEINSSPVSTSPINDASHSSLPDSRHAPHYGSQSSNTSHNSSSTLPPTLSAERLALMDRLTRESIDERLRVLEGVSGAVYRCIDDLMRMRSALPVSNEVAPATATPSAINANNGDALNSPLPAKTPRQDHLAGSSEPNLSGSISSDAIRTLLLSPAFTTSFKRISNTGHGLAFPLNFSSTLDELNLLSILSLLNFGSGYRVELHSQVGRGAWDTVRAFVFSLYLSSSIDGGDLLSARGIATIDVSKVAELMGVNVHIERPHENIVGLTIGQLGGPMYELVNLVTRVLNETGQVLVNSGYPNLGAFVAETLKEGASFNIKPEETEGLESVLERRVRRYQAVYCFKKALFLIHAVVIKYGSMSPPPFPLPKTSLSPVFTDNVLPSMLIHFGVINVSAAPELSSLFPGAGTSESLKSLLDVYTGAPMPPQVPAREGPVVTPDQAYALRAAAIDACEHIMEIAHSLETSPDENSSVVKDLTLPGLDMWIWAVAKDRPDYKQLPRRSSRPSSIHISPTEWSSDIVLENSSPSVIAKPNGVLDSSDPATTPRSSLLPTPPSVVQPRPIPQYAKPADSPCFVHSHLDKGASLSEWLRNKQYSLATMNGDVGVAKSLQTPSDLLSPPGSTPVVASSTFESDEESFGESLTKQLAETAVSVREMSKQLGRARVHTDIQTVLIITKARDNRLIKLTRELALYLMLRPRKDQKRGLVVYVDSQLRHSRRFDAEAIRAKYPHLFIPFPRRRTSSSTSVSSLTSGSSSKSDIIGVDDGQLRYWTSSMCSQTPQLFDFVVTLGGDGTVLFTSWLFQRIVPPVLPFALGSLGFLTNFDFADYQGVMDSVLDSGIRVNLRMRFTCTVYRAVSCEEGKRRKAVKKGETGEIMMKNVEQGGWEALEAGWSGAHSVGDGKCNAKDREIMCFTTRAAETFEVLNDLVVDRGPSPYVSLLELFGDEHHMTTVQADGLTVSTPTGSTAYSLSAGGSLVHPEIPSILITPICPHTLSFRPMLLPDSMELRICVPYNSRSTAWASFDGRGRVELKQGDHIKITASKYPFPTVCADKQSTDWFHAISRTLKWNERERQKSFVVVEEESPTKPKKRGQRAFSALETTQVETPEVVEESSEDVEEEEDEVSDEDTFDITDSSPEATNILASNGHTGGDETSGRQIYTEDLSEAVPSGNAKSQSRPGLRSGVDSPGRFAGPPPHLPARHVDFNLSPSDSNAEDNDAPRLKSITRAPRPQSGRSRGVKIRDVDFDNARTPTSSTLSYGRMRLGSRSRSADHPGRRAFAVWGNDESDSNASDSSAGE
ncbi:hypothetical protein H0H93_009712 [Arthromyces matolae]|nr:hypothetical protein H0H93_009712 [Arthromyces matolae]